MAAEHSTTVPTYTWTGADAATSTNWSDAGNWSGGRAPKPHTTVALVFPALSCQLTTNCGSTNDDVSGLTVSSFVTEADGEANPYPAYSFGGDAIKLAGPFSTVVDQTDGTDTYGLSLGMPVTVSKAATWDFDGGQTVFYGGVTGAVKLTISLAHGGGFSINNGFDVGAVSVLGADTSLTGGASYGNGTLFVAGGGDLNGVNGHAVTVRNAVIFVPGETGPLTTSGDNIQLGTGDDTTIAGRGALTKTDYLPVYNLTPGDGSPSHPADYPQLTGTGPLALGNAQIGLFADCGQAVGTTYILVSAASLTGKLDTTAGQPISNGTIVAANGDGSSSCDGAAPPNLEISYNDAAGTVTARVVAASAGAGAVSGARVRQTVRIRAAAGIESATH